MMMTVIVMVMMMMIVIMMMTVMLLMFVVKGDGDVDATTLGNKNMQGQTQVKLQLLKRAGLQERTPRPLSTTS